MFPLHDNNPTRSTPVVTVALVVANVVVFLIQLAGVEASVFRFGLIPAELLQGADTVYHHRALGQLAGEGVRNVEPAWITLFSSMFMHGGWLHLISNMWFLWLFGNNVEDSMGHLKYLLFYVGAGLAAAAAQIAVGSDSVIPMVGASGAIGGVLGAYLVLFPHSRVLTLVTAFFITTVELPAIVVLGMWFLLQVISGIGAFGLERSGGVAYAAHVGGFVAGLLLGRLLGTVHRGPQARYSPGEVDWR